MNREAVLRSRIRIIIMAFIVGLVLSGLTAVPVQWELNHLVAFMQGREGTALAFPSHWTEWAVQVRDGAVDAYGKYPFLAYGLDWLAFGHLMIALAFIGPLRDPVRNIWVIEWGMIACVCVLPVSLIWSPIRHIPFFHRLVDAAFGVVGIIPLWICHRWIRELSKLQSKS